MTSEHHILFSSNHAYAEPLLAAVKSLLSATGSPGKISIHVIDRGLPREVHLLLQAYEWQFGASITVYRYDEQLVKDFRIPEEFDQLTSFGHYDRLLAPFLIPADRALYLDCDILVQSDIVELCERDLGEYAVAAVQDHFIEALGGPSGVFDWEDRGFDPNGEYFNSGVLLIDLERWRNQQIAQACIQLAFEFQAVHGTAPPLFDQYVLNVHFYESWERLPLGWNRFADFVSATDPPPKLVHFAGIRKAFSPSGESNRSSRYFARSCHRLIRDDWNDAAPISGIRRYGKTAGGLPLPSPSLKTPNGADVTPVPPSALAHLPDDGQIVMIIPVMIQDENSIRFANFAFLLEIYSRASLTIIVAEQKTMDSPPAIDREIDRISSDRLHHLPISIEDSKIHKSRLINEGVRFAGTLTSVKYFWQIDADILIHPQSILNQLNALNSRTIPVIRPLLWFVRLGETRSEEIRQFSEEQLGSFDPNEESTANSQLVDLFGPGTMIFSAGAFAESGGYDENFTGWGWEDVDFARRLSARFHVHTLPLTGAHLYHENDRSITPLNFDRYVRTNHVYQRRADFDREFRFTRFVNGMELFCVIHPPRLSVTADQAGPPSILFNQGAIVPAFLPKEPGYSRNHVEHIVYSLTHGNPDVAGFSWRPDQKITDPVNQSVIDPADLVDSLISHAFRFLVIEPEAGADSLRDQIVFAQILQILRQTCEKHMTSFPKTVKVLSAWEFSGNTIEVRQAYERIFLAEADSEVGARSRIAKSAS